MSSQNILAEFYNNPQQKIHIRELARRVSKHPNTIISLTDELQEQELLTKEQDKHSNRILISPNTKQPYFSLRCTGYHIQQLYRSGLIRHLQEHYFHPTIVLFGSIAKAQHKKDSDIDIFIVSDINTQIDLSEYEHILNREIQLIVKTKKEYPEFTKSNPELANNILNGILLEGYMQVYS
jgi:predicted nucleotidyltransferase